MLREHAPALCGYAAGLTDRWIRVPLGWAAFPADAWGVRHGESLMGLDLFSVEDLPRDTRQPA